MTSWSTRIIKERAAELPPPAALTDNSGGLSGLHYGAGGVSRRRNAHPGRNVTLYTSYTIMCESSEYTKNTRSCIMT